MDQTTTNQVGGVVRATVPAILTVLVAVGWMDQTVAEAVTEPVVIIAGAVGTLATSLAVFWSLWKNRPAAVVETAAAAAPKGLKIVVGEQAPDAIKAVAADPTMPNVVRGQV